MYREPFIDETFITTLFQHPFFIKKLQSSRLQKIANVSHGFQIQKVVEEISTLMLENFNDLFEGFKNDAKRKLDQLSRDIEKVKEFQISISTKIDSTSKEIYDDAIFEDEQQFDLPSIKRTLYSLHQKMKEISLNSSILDSSQLKESRYQDVVHQRINGEMDRLQKSFSYQQQHLQDLINKRLEKQQKTINNILQTINDMSQNKLDKLDKNASLLTNSKSAVKLKTFFGFG